MSLTPRRQRRRTAGAGLALLSLLALAPAARADDDHRPAAVPPLPAYDQECGSCHVAYPPGLLPAASWQRLMANLPRHFGTDASLDAATLQALSAYLAATPAASRRWRVTRRRRPRTSSGLRRWPLRW